MQIIKQFNTALPAHFEANRTQVNVGITPAIKTVEETEVSGYEYFTACFEHPEMYTDDALVTIAEKEVKNYLLANSTITTSYGNVFDATNQARIDLADAIRGAETTKELIDNGTLPTDTVWDRTTWKLADNSKVEVTLVELKEASLLAVKEYARIKEI